MASRPWQASTFLFLMIVKIYMYGRYLVKVFQDNWYWLHLIDLKSIGKTLVSRLLPNLSSAAGSISQKKS